MDTHGLVALIVSVGRFGVSAGRFGVSVGRFGVVAWVGLGCFGVSVGCFGVVAWVGLLRCVRELRMGRTPWVASVWSHGLGWVASLCPWFAVILSVGTHV